MAARADAATPSTTSTPSASTGAGPAARARGRGGLRRARSAIPSATRSRRRRARSRSTRWRSPPNPDPYGLGAIPPIPTWIPAVEADPRHPLRLCHARSRARARTRSTTTSRCSPAPTATTSGSTPPTPPRAASPTAQRVRVFNDRGATVLPARVTDRIAPGVVSIKEGAWFTPDDDGDDTRGCANVLTDDRSSPCGRHHLQHLPGRGGAGAGARVAADRDTDPGHRGAPPSGACRAARDMVGGERAR